MNTLDDLEIEGFLGEHPQWERDGNAIRRTFRLTDFVAAMGFVTRVALIAQRLNHHPDIDIRWNEVTLMLTSHDAGGITDRDTELARHADRVVVAG